MPYFLATMLDLLLVCLSRNWKSGIGRKWWYLRIDLFVLQQGGEEDTEIEAGVGKDCSRNEFYRHPNQGIPPR